MLNNYVQIYHGQEINPFKLGIPGDGARISDAQEGGSRDLVIDAFAGYVGSAQPVHFEAKNIGSIPECQNLKAQAFCNLFEQKIEVLNAGCDYVSPI